jgi:hypothetical protein
LQIKAITTLLVVVDGFDYAFTSIALQLIKQNLKISLADFERLSFFGKSLKEGGITKALKYGLKRGEYYTNNFLNPEVIIDNMPNKNTRIDGLTTLETILDNKDKLFLSFIGFKTIISCIANNDWEKKITFTQNSARIEMKYFEWIGKLLDDNRYELIANENNRLKKITKSIVGQKNREIFELMQMIEKQNEEIEKLKKIIYPT